MSAMGLILSTVLLAQAPAAVPEQEDASVPRATTLAEQARREREATVAKRRAGRQTKAVAQAARRAHAAQQEAKIRDYELKMAPIVAAQQVEMARLRAQEQQAAFDRQAVMNAQQFQAARLAQENERLQMDYWRSKQPLQVIVKP